MRQSDGYGHGYGDASPSLNQGVYSSGIPLQPNKVWRKTAALVMNIDDMSKRLKSLERKVNQQD